MTSHPHIKLAWRHIIQAQIDHIIDPRVNIVARSLAYQEADQKQENARGK
jgi:hypothetical protein